MQKSATRHQEFDAIRYLPEGAGVKRLYLTENYKAQNTKLLFAAKPKSVLQSILLFRFD